MGRLMTNCIFLMQLMTCMKNGKFLRLRDKAQARWMSTRLKYAKMERCSFSEALESLVTYRIVFTVSTQPEIFGRLNSLPLINNQVHEPAIQAS